MRLMDFPLLVQNKIIPQFELADVIELTMMSRKFHRNMQVVKLPILEFQYFFTTTTVAIFINKAVEFNISSYIPNATHRKINGKSITIEERKCDSLRFLMKSRFSTESELQTLLEQASIHLLAFLKLPKSQHPQLCFNRNIPLKNLFIWKNHQKFSKISVRQYNESPVKLDQEDLIYLLEQAKTDELILNVTTKNGNFEYSFFNIQQTQPVLVQEKMEILNSSWLDFGWFWQSMNTKSLTLRLRDEDYTLLLTRLLRQWRVVQNDHLGKLVIYSMFKKDPAQIFDGTNSVTSEFRRPQLRMHFPKLLDDEHFVARDIQRARDKRLATVILTRSKILMVVWNEENSNAGF